MFPKLSGKQPLGEYMYGERSKQPTSDVMLLGWTKLLPCHIFKFNRFHLSATSFGGNFSPK